MHVVVGAVGVLREHASRREVGGVRRRGRRSAVGGSHAAGGGKIEARRTTSAMTVTIRGNDRDNLGIPLCETRTIVNFRYNCNWCQI